MAASKIDLADGASHVERLNRDVDEIMAALETWRSQPCPSRRGTDAPLGAERVASGTPGASRRTAPGSQRRLLNKPTFLCLSPVKRLEILR